MKGYNRARRDNEILIDSLSESQLRWLYRIYDADWYHCTSTNRQVDEWNIYPYILRDNINEVLKDIHVKRNESINIILS